MLLLSYFAKNTCSAKAVFLWGKDYSQVLPWESRKPEGESKKPEKESRAEKIGRSFLIEYQTGVYG